MAARTETGVDLGFVEEKTDDKWKLLSHFFPSKVGGKPAWLVLKGVPSGDDVKCPICQKPCVFLLQVYAPLNDRSSCFHRTLFLFVCKEPKCNQPNTNTNLVVLRSQLTRVNAFYSDQNPESTPFDASSVYPKADDHHSLCHVCGCAGPKACARCHTVNYCGREHQTLDWKSQHKQICSTGKSPSTGKNKLLFPEYELVMEPELQQEKTEKSEKQKLEDYKTFLNSSQADKSQLGNTKEIQQSLEQMSTGEEGSDKQFLKFRKKVASEPEQVLRYERGGQPLWVTNTGQPSQSDIPDCTCGSPRIFEFQVMPQLLNHLNVDSTGESLDWGTLAVYTCQESCHTDKSYCKEFVWKQDIISDSLH